MPVVSKRSTTTSCSKCLALFTDNGWRGAGDSERVLKIDWKARTGRRHRHEGEATAQGVKWIWLHGGSEVRKQLKWRSSFFFFSFGLLFNLLTIFGRLDPGAFVLPKNGWWWRTDNITNYVSVVALVEFLQSGRSLECDFFCRERYTTFLSDICTNHRYRISRNESHTKY